MDFTGGGRVELPSRKLIHSNLPLKPVKNEYEFKFQKKEGGVGLLSEEEYLHRIQREVETTQKGGKLGNKEKRGP